MYYNWVVMFLRPGGGVRTLVFDFHAKPFRDAIDILENIPLVGVRLKRPGFEEKGPILGEQPGKERNIDKIADPGLIQSILFGKHFNIAVTQVVENTLEQPANLPRLYSARIEN